MELQFEKNGQHLIAVDAGWKDNDYSVYEVQMEDGTFIDTLLVHPLDTLEHAVSEWIKG